MSGSFKNMADKRMSENLEVLERRSSLSLEGAEVALSFGDENRPLSPGEVAVMRNQTTVTGRLLSPARKSRSDSATDNRRSRTKYFGSPKTRQVKSATEKDPNQDKRKTLQVLQPSANGTGLVGCSAVQRNEQKLRKKKNPQLKQGKLSGLLKESTTSSADSSDSDAPSKIETKKSNDPVADEIALMISDTPTERYWEILSEERRVALQDALEENQQLHQQLEEMQERCKKLEEVAGQAEYFASLYQLVMEGETAEDLDSSDPDEYQSKPARNSADE